MWLHTITPLAFIREKAKNNIDWSTIYRQRMLFLQDAIGVVSAAFVEQRETHMRPEAD
jgi:hypothetical protein